jgi:hypothetical protein
MFPDQVLVFTCTEKQEENNHQYSSHFYTCFQMVTETFGFNDT